MDQRAAICGAISLTSIVAAGILGALPAGDHTGDTIAGMMLLATTTAGYVVGLYSTPNAKPGTDNGDEA